MLTSLEVKTSYSILGSLNKIEALVSRAKELGYSSLAITDTNNMFGSYEFYLTCLKYNIKPIIGIEILFDDKRFILLAKNNNGYKNLIKLSTLISEDNINEDVLKLYNKDIILIIPYECFDKRIISIYDEYFIGYSSLDDINNIDDNKVFINDTCYIDRNDYKYLDYLIMIREDKKLGEFELGTYKGRHLLTKEEFDSFVPNNIISNMKYIEDVCNVSFEYNSNLLPIYDENIDAFEFLTNLCNK